MIPVPSARERNSEPTRSRSDDAPRPSRRDNNRQPQPEARNATPGRAPLPTERPARGDDTRRSNARERTSGSESGPQARKPRSEPTGQDVSLFDVLLDKPAAPPPLAGITLSGMGGMPTQAASQPQPASSPVTVWQQLEPQLCGALDKQPAGPLAMTLLLPKLGEVDARLSPLAAGWDISLRFAPEAMAMLAPHQERCRESLRRRMACQVRLRFEQRGGRE